MAKAQDPELRKAGLAAISHAKRFHGALVKLVDDNPRDKELVTLATETIANLRNKDDVPELLELVRRRHPTYSGVRTGGNIAPVFYWLGYKARDAMRVRRYGDEPLWQAAATALIAMQDERAIDGLLDAEVFQLQGDVYPVAAFGMRALPRLIAIAQNPNDARCYEAAAHIGAFKDPDTIPTLIGLVNQDNYGPEIRANALKSLWAMQAKEAEALTEKLLHDPSSNVQMRTVETLLRSGNAHAREKTVQRLAGAVVSRGDMSVESRIIELLGESGDFRFAATVSKFLASRDTGIRNQAMEYLAKTDLKKYLPALCELLEHPNWQVRREILEFLAGKKEKGAVPYAIKMLDDPSQWVRLEAGKCLAVVDYENQLPHILELLKDPDREVRGEALKLFMEKEEMQAVPYAEQFLGDPDDDTRFTAAKLLERTTGKIYSYQQNDRTRNLERSYKELHHDVQEDLNSKDPSYRAMAIYAVTKANYETYLPQILKLLDDPDITERATVLAWLREKKEKRAIPYAEKLLEDSSDDVRFAAAKFLEVMTGRIVPYRQTQITQILEKEYQAQHGESFNGKN